jgi:YegS/Rv2252/BmrU family lipid kinase
MTRWWVIVNPAAGREGDLVGRVERALEDRHIEYATRVSPGPDAVGDLVAEGRRSGYDAFVAVGGDGTANLVVNGMMTLSWAAPPTLAILPAGSGSDFIRTFAISEHLETASDHLIDEARYAVDVGALEGDFGRRYFLNAANAGIAAQTVIEAQRLPARLGSQRYIVGFWAALARTQPGDVHIDCDGRHIDTRAMNVVVANGQYFGGGMNVAPRAAAGDGLFDVQVISGARVRAPAVIRRIVRGTHLTHTAVRRTVGKRVAVDIPETWKVEADGEIIGSGSFTAEAIGDRLLFKI